MTSKLKSFWNKLVGHIDDDKAEYCQICHGTKSEGFQFSCSCAYKSSVKEAEISLKEKQQQILMNQVELASALNKIVPGSFIHVKSRGGDSWSAISIYQSLIVYWSWYREIFLIFKEYQLHKKKSVGFVFLNDMKIKTFIVVY